MSQALNLNNKYRVLLTEVLPYEIPLMLDNEAFYYNVLDPELLDVFNEAFRGLNKWNIPFDYSVRKYGGDKSRKLSLMHPVTQLKCVDFYEKYNLNMLSWCRKSPFSLRHIDNISKSIFNTEVDGIEVKESIEENNGDKDLSNRIELQNDEIEKKYRSYFSYKRYDMLYKFFISGDNLRLEQKYSHMMKMDIASCFYHIYTHTITWAVKGKEQAKNLVGKRTFENEFDHLMQETNYNETNGIIVGPEISRIFAEIILQTIDVNVLNQLKEGNSPIRLGKDYEVRRYVDDYFVYANSKETLEKILSVYKEELQFYKLYVNEKKTEFFERPFVSDASDAKSEINNIIEGISNRYLTIENGHYIRQMSGEMNVFKSTVNKYRSLAHRFKQNYGTTNRYFLSLLSSQINRECQRTPFVKPSLSLLLMYVEVSFYVFSLDMSTSASIKMCRIMQSIHDWANKCAETTILQEVESRIQREAKRCLDIYEATKRDGEVNIEVMNLLLAMHRMMNTRISKEQLVSLFNISNGRSEEYRQLNYFQICTLLALIGKNADYEEIRLQIVEEVHNRIYDNSSLLRADNAMLFFDFMVCPFIKKKEKNDIIMKVYGCKESKSYEKLKIINKTSRWFFSWNSQRSLDEFLSKKEYHSPYE